MLGLEEPIPDPKDKWDPPNKRSTQKSVPDLIGLSFNQVKSILSADNFFVSKITYADSEQPRDTVLRQHPVSGNTVMSPSGIDIVLASGLSVQIPDVLGKTLSQSIVMLREAGLESEPQILFVPQDTGSTNQVISISPKSRIYVTPNSTVEITVIRRSKTRSGRN